MSIRYKIVFVFIAFYLYNCSERKKNVENLLFLHTNKSVLSFDTLTITEEQLKSVPQTDIKGYKDLNCYYNYWLLNKEYNIIHKFPTNCIKNLKGSFEKQDSLFILNNRFCIEDLLNLKEDVIFPFIFKLYTFYLNNKHYLLITLKFYYTKDNDMCHNLLFNISNKTNIIPIKLVNFSNDLRGDSYACYPYYFGDFNLDGELDVLLVKKYGFMQLYTIKNNIARELTDKYIYYEYENNYMLILGKSNWYNKFNEKQDEKYKFKIDYPNYYKSVYINQ